METQQINTSEKYFFEVYDLSKGRQVFYNIKDMVKFAKDILRQNHKIGLDKELKLSDFNYNDYSINAWVYLRNIGIAENTNKEVW